jgi:hypothetical protein
VDARAGGEAPPAAPRGKAEMPRAKPPGGQGSLF